MNVWRGYHSVETLAQVTSAWEKNSLLCLVPPSVKDIPELQILISALPKFSDPPVFALLTTGTQSRKMILYSKKNIEASLKGILSFFDESKIESVFCYPQPYHVFGLVLGYLFSVLYGKKLICHGGPYCKSAHGSWNQAIDNNSLTLGTPTHFQDLIEHVKSSGLIPNRSYSAIAGGAPVSKSLWLAIRDQLNIQQPSIGYGASELSPGATHLPPGHCPVEDGEIGFALPNLQIEIEAELGIRVTGANVCLAMIEAGVLSFPTSIQLRDQVVKRTDGSMVFNKRLDLSLNRGGEKFSFERIENFLWDSAKIKAVGVAVPHQRLGEELALLIERKEDLHTSFVCHLLKEEFGREFERKYFFEVDILPIDNNSKVDRNVARRYAEERT